MNKQSRYLKIRVAIVRIFAGLLSGWWVCCLFSSAAMADQSAMGVQASALQEAYQTDLFTGRAISDIPVLVPPGRQKMQPEAHLVYHSGGGNGWCGVGWDLDLGYIQRDTRKGVPTYTSIDTFNATIQGSVDPLVSIGNNEYRAKVDSAFRKYVFNGTAWEMWEKDGTHYFFGTTGASRVENGKGIFRWSLDKVVDTHGNMLTITYTQDQGQLYPAQIQYAGNEVTGDLPTNTVDFVLETRPDPIVSYRSGIKMVIDSRLKAIVVKANGVLVRRYALAYTQDQDVTARSLLAGVTLYGDDDTASLPPVTFTYAQQKSVTLGSPGSWITFSKSMPFWVTQFNVWTPMTLDVDGDGVTDAGMYMVFGYSGSHDSYFKAGLSTTSAFQGYQYNPLSVSTSGGLTENNLMVLQGDFNGDGLADVAERQADGSWRVALAELRDYSGQRRLQFHTPTPWISGFGQASEGWKIFTGDFNGDGITDLARAKIISGTWTVQVALSNGSTAFSSPTNWLTGATGSGEWLTGDFNGDGLTDLCLAVAGTGQWKEFSSTGTQFLDEGVWLSGWGTGVIPLATDVNGDGFTDALTYDSSSGQWQYALSDGTKFIAAGTWVTGLGQGSGWTPVVGDFNGDGLLDAAVCNVETGGWVVATSSGIPFTPLIQATNGRGGSTTIAYRMYRENSPLSINSPVPYLPFPMLVVDAVTVSDGLGRSWTSRYSYSRSLYNSTAREWRGFRDVEVTDAEGRKEKSTFFQDDIFKGRLQLRIVSGSTDSSLAKVSLTDFYTWTSSSPYPGVTAPSLSSTSQSLTDAEGNSRVRWTQFSYDAYGNVATRWEKGQPGQSPESDAYGLWDDTVTYFSYAYNTNAWIL
ncbi:MAG: VCBS repeat-containing protein, partial [Elusimicrobia bacterium]|nr:VCBS repeat-containing protein [Elusimicrobiota bacterium]